MAEVFAEKRYGLETEITSSDGSTLNHPSWSAIASSRSGTAGKSRMRMPNHAQNLFIADTSSSSLSPCTMRLPRRTLVSEGYPLPPLTDWLESGGGYRI